MIHHFAPFFFSGVVSLLETKIPKSYIDVEKAVTKIAEELNARSEMPVLNGIKFR